MDRTGPRVWILLGVVLFLAMTIALGVKGRALKTQQWQAAAQKMGLRYEANKLQGQLSGVDVDVFHTSEGDRSFTVFQASVHWPTDVYVDNRYGQHLHQGIRKLFKDPTLTGDKAFDEVFRSEGPESKVKTLLSRSRRNLLLEKANELRKVIRISNGKLTISVSGSVRKTEVLVKHLQALEALAKEFCEKP